MDELLEILESCPNVSSLEYDTEKQAWTIYYKNGLNPDTVDSDQLLEFLKYA